MTNDINISFEFFPPSSDKAANNLWEAIKKLAPLNPNFVSVTYGAGGTTRDRTHNTIKRIIDQTSLSPAAHLTCVGTPKTEIDGVINDYYNMGVRHIVALRGDPLSGIDQKYEPHPNGYQTSIDLVAGIKNISSDFEVSVSAYPEKHPQSPDWETEIDFLKRKVDAGASRAISQFFFFNDYFEAYVDRVRSAGITIPIVPGIILITNFEQTKNFASKTGTTIPMSLAKRFSDIENDPETRKLAGIMYAAEQVGDLVSRGFKEFHFYTMNRSDLVYALCHSLGIREPKSLINNVA